MGGNYREKQILKWEGEAGEEFLYSWEIETVVRALKYKPPDPSFRELRFCP